MPRSCCGVAPQYQLSPMTTCTAAGAGPQGAHLTLLQNACNAGPHARSCCLDPPTHTHTQTKHTRSRKPAHFPPTSGVHAPPAGQAPSAGVVGRAVELHHLTAPVRSCG
jgi:hypothetical protein